METKICPKCKGSIPRDAEPCPLCGHGRGSLNYAAKPEVVVTDIKIPFGSMVTLMVKWAIATIPALLILMLIGVFFMSFFSGLVGNH